MRPPSWGCSGGTRVPGTAMTAKRSANTEQGRDRRLEATTVNVKVRSIGLINSLLGQAERDLALPGGTMIDGLLGRLSELGGEKLAPYLAVPKELSAHAPLRVMVNGRDIAALQGRQTVLQDGDDVLIFIPIAGG